MMPSVLGADSMSDVMSLGGQTEEAESDQYTDESDSGPENDENDENIVWTGYQSKVPIVVFKPEVIARKIPELRAVGERFHLSFKIVKTECKLVRSILQGHGFHEAHPNSSDFNLMWTGSHLKPFVLRSLTEYQKINHFPRSYEITRKDRLFKNIQRMQQTKGFKHFDFVPSSYILPAEYQDFCSGFLREKGSWIVKPIASSRGRGIFLINHPEQAPLDEQMIVSKYVSNPYLIDGYKFDIRLYVAVTSYDPLVVYLYEEGLTRFATVKFDKAARFIRNQCMHLTNYSVNKKNQDFVHNDDAEVEDFGNKWSLGALLRFLKSEGKDVSALMCRIEDVVVKTLVSVEAQVGTACKMFMPFKGNCFELYGFDILLDEDLRPWILEVNLSPSLACDAPLDLKIKTNMMCDLFSLVGFVCHDPMTRKVAQSKRNMDTASKTAARSLRVRPGSTPSSQRQPRPSSASSMTSLNGAPPSLKSGSLSGLSGDEIRIVRRAKEEMKRCGGWVRIFPTHDTWDLYSHFFSSSSTHNHMLHQRLFCDEPPLIKPQNSIGMSTRFSSRGGFRFSGPECWWLLRGSWLPAHHYMPNLVPFSTRSIQLHSSNNPSAVLASQGNRDFEDRAKRRSKMYERKLRSLGRSRRKRANKPPRPSGPQQHGIFRGRVVPPNEQTDEDGRSTQEAVTSPLEFSSQETMVATQTASKVKVTSSNRERDTKDEEPAADDDSDPELPRPQPRYQDQNRDPKLLETRLNLVTYLEKGGALSKVQARTAFATYLIRVKHRLMSDIDTIGNGDAEEMNEQMDLVLRFLKRAAGNLQHPFRVVVPSRKLPLVDRRRILANQLGEFVQLYSRETEQLRLVRFDSAKSNKVNEAVDEQKFAYFLSTACESELEEVLTVYTKVHKSASIFIGSSQTSNTSATPITPANTSLSASTPAGSVSSSKGVSGPTVNGHSGIGSSGGPENNGARSGTKNEASRPPQGVDDDRSISSTSSRQVTRSKRSTHSSYASAVAIYSGRLRSPAVKIRPASAITTRMVTEPPVIERMQSAGHSRRTTTLPHTFDHSMTDAARDVLDEPSEEIMNEALQRLSLRQQQRQYSAKSSNVLTTPSNSKQQQQQHSINSPVSQASRYPVKLQRSDTWMDAHTEAKTVDQKRPVQRFSNLDTSPETAVSKYSESRTNPQKMDVNFHLNELARRFTLPKNGNMFMRNDFPFWEPDLRKEKTSFGEQQTMIKQQRMIEQSKALLEQSKAKHQAMIAHAHAARSDPKSAKSRGQVVAPKPPAGVRRKPMSANRLARTATVDEATESRTQNDERSSGW